MPVNIAFHVLNVGQGSGNFVEIFAKDGDTVPKTTVLIDLGSEGASTSHHGPSLDRIVASLKSMTKPEIACLCLSHSDTDHISMIAQLLAAFDPPGTKNPTKPILTINKVYYGGNPKLYNKPKVGGNVLKKLDPYSPAELFSVTSNTTTYKNGVPMYEDKALQFKLHLLIGNTVKAEDEEIDDSEELPKTGAVNINTVSLVVVFDWKGVQFITTGDATGITMMRANSVLGSGSGSFFPDPLMITAPHHGSFRTAFDFTGQGLSGDDEKREQIDLFARRCGAKLLTASAGEVARFKHPSAVILDIFWKYCTDEKTYQDPAAIKGAHFYTAHYSYDNGFKLKTNDGTIDWPPEFFSWWYTVQTVVPVFTTDYFVSAVIEAGTQQPKTKTTQPKKKSKPEPVPYMAVLPQSVSAPSPGSTAPIPDKKKFPPEEVGWTIAMDADLKYSVDPIKPDADSIAALHALVRNAEVHYGLVADSASAPAAVRRTRLESVRPAARQPRPTAPGSLLPQPRRR